MAIYKPASLTKEQIIQYRELYKKYFSEEISHEQAHIEGLCLMRFIAEIIEANSAFCDYPEHQNYSIDA